MIAATHRRWGLQSPRTKRNQTGLQPLKKGFPFAARNLGGTPSHSQNAVHQSPTIPIDRMFSSLNTAKASRLATHQQALSIQAITNSLFLFVIPALINPFRIKQIHTLAQKHPGVGYPQNPSFKINNIQTLPPPQLQAPCRLSTVASGLPSPCPPCLCGKPVLSGFFRPRLPSTFNCRLSTAAGPILHNTDFSFVHPRAIVLSFRGNLCPLTRRRSDEDRSPDRAQRRGISY